LSKLEPAKVLVVEDDVDVDDEVEDVDDEEDVVEVDATGVGRSELLSTPNASAIC